MVGGTLYIELLSCAPGMVCNGSDVRCPDAPSLPSYSDVMYTIKKCSFINNKAETPDYKTYSLLIIQIQTISPPLVMEVDCLCLSRAELKTLVLL